MTQTEKAIKFAEKAISIEDVSCIDGLDALKILARKLNLLRSIVEKSYCECSTASPINCSACSIREEMEGIL